MCIEDFLHEYQFYNNREHYQIENCKCVDTNPQFSMHNHYTKTFFY